jgi:hypothetical protein
LRGIEFKNQHASPRLDLGRGSVEQQTTKTDSFLREGTIFCTLPHQFSVIVAPGFRHSPQMELLGRTRPQRQPPGAPPHSQIFRLHSREVDHAFGRTEIFRLPFEKLQNIHVRVQPRQAELFQRSLGKWRTLPATIRISVVLQCEEKLFTYSMEEILWYFGHESKRNPQSKWTITFIERKMHPQRTKNCPYFGNVLVWNDPQTRAKWLGSMLKARYRDSLMQPAMHVNLMQN